MGERDQPREIKSVGTSCRIVDALVELNRAGVTELADYLDISKGTVYTHLQTLLSHERVVKDGDDYRPSFRYLEIGEQLRRQQDLVPIVEPELEELAERTGYRSHFAIEEHGKSVLLYYTAGSNALASTTHIGHRRHLHCTAGGKALLAHLPQSRVEEIIESIGLVEYTENTITDPETLFAELETIREEGVSYNRGEHVKRLRAIGAPILDSDNELLGAISITIPLGKASENSDEELANRVRNVSNKIGINYEIQFQDGTT